MAQEIYHRSEWGNPTETWGNVYLNADLTNELYKRASEYENSWVTDQLLNGVGIKPSIILTPTAYEDGVLNSVKPAKTFGSELMPSIAIIENNNGGIITQINGNSYSSTSDGTSSSSIRPKFDFATTSGKTYKLVITPIGTVTGTVNFDFYDGSTYLFQNYDFTSTKEITFTDNVGVFGAFDGTQTYSISNFTISIKEVIDADFDFTRGSSATRVNELGLVQDVQLLSGELVQNGDFEQIGSELVTNGSFDTDSDWSKGTGWSIANGNASYDGSGTGYQYILQSISTTSGSIYKINFDVLSSTGTNLNIVDFGAVRLNLTHLNQGNYTFYAEADSTSENLAIYANGTDTFSIDNVSVKKITEADFDFTRGSSATRVNEKGLVQDVQLLSGELVQNGDFEQIGSELVTNGGFDSDTDWTKGATWSIANGKASSDGLSNNSLSQTTPILEVGKTYKLKIDITHTSGTLLLLGAYYETQISFTESGSYDIFIVPKVTTFSVYASSFVGSIDNVSVKEVGQNWTFGTGWSMGDGKAIYTGTTNSDLAQSGILTSGKFYKLQYEVINSTLVNGVVKLSGTTASAQNVLSQTVGKHTLYFTANGTAPTSLNIRIVLNTSGQYEIDNISVIEITDDTDLPRINYKDGEGSLLLEPQSTNLVTYSEDFSEWSLGANATLTFVSDIEAPDGSLGVYRLQLPATNDTFIASNSFTGQNPLALSIYAKSVNTNNDFNLYNGSASSPIKTATNEWQRFDFIGNGNQFFIVNSGDTFITDIYIWGAQAEALSYATSYIPTNGSTVTRLADVCNNSGNSDLINSTEGVLYAEISALANDGTVRYFGLNDGSNNNRAVFLFDSTANRVRAIVSSGGTKYVDFNYTVTDLTEFHKIALKYKADDFALWIDGVERNTDTSGLTPIGLDNLEFDLNLGGALYGNVKCLAVFKEALSDTELQKLTTI